MKGSPGRRPEMNTSYQGSLVSFNAANSLKNESPEEIDTSIFAKIGVEIE
jgi:hypothetical protein